MEKPPLPSHRLRFSKRARRINLRVVPGRGLEVVLPEGSDPACVPSVLERHRTWIETALARLTPCQPDPELPLSFTLKGGMEEVRVHPLDAEQPWPPGRTPSRRRALWEPGPDQAGPAGTGAADAHSGRAQGQTVLAGAADALSGVSQGPSGLVKARHTGDQAAAGPDLLRPGHGAGDLLPTLQLSAPGIAPRLPRVRHLAVAPAALEVQLTRLREWVREEARVWLGRMIDDVAEAHGFTYSRFAIRFQKSRWGSCSGKGSINLNACLLFLPERLARYIVLHELCHTRQMNHSAAFWKLVFAADPTALDKDRAMRRAWKHVPAWIFPHP